MPEDTKKYQVGDKTYNVPAADVDGFLKRKPDAVLVHRYEFDGNTYSVPETDTADFLSRKPEAKLISGPKKKDSSTASDVPDTPSVAGSTPESPSPLPSTVGDSIIAGTPEKDPILQRASAKSPWLAAPINYLSGAIHGVGSTIMKPLDGAQKLFYRGVGELMSGSTNPSIKAAGAKLLVEQDKKKTWWKRAEESINKFTKEKMPPKIGEPGSPYKADAISDLVYTAGELTPFMATVAVTPNPTVAGVGMKLPINMATIGGLESYSDTGDLGQAVKAGAIGAGDGLAFTALGYGTGIASQKIAGQLLKVASPWAAEMGATTSKAGGMFGGGMAHDVAKQISEGVAVKDLDWERARHSGLTFLMLEAPGIINAAVSVYKQAPKETRALSRNIDASVNEIRNRAVELEVKAEKEVNPEKKAELLIAASNMHKLADMKGMDEFFGRNPEEARKMVQESQLNEKDKADMLERIDDSVLYQQQLEQTKDLQTAGDQVKKAEEKKAAERMERPPAELKVEKTEAGKFVVKQEGEMGMTKEFETQKEADTFVENFKELTQGERTFEEQKTITDEKVAAGEAKKPEPKVTKAEPSTGDAVTPDGEARIRKAINENEGTRGSKPYTRKRAMEIVDQMAKEGASEKEIIDHINEEYSIKLDVAPGEAKKPETALAKDMLKLAENLRKGKIDPKDTMTSTIPGMVPLWNLGVEGAARAVEAGATTVEAINRALKDIKESPLYQKLDDKQKAAIEKQVKADLDKLIKGEAPGEVKKPKEKKEAPGEAKKAKDTWEMTQEEFMGEDWVKNRQIDVTKGLEGKEADAALDAYAAKEKKFKKYRDELFNAYSLGKITQKEAADKLGVPEDRFDTRNTKDVPSDKPMYHATVNLGKVKSEGLKTKQQVLSEGGTEGIGGGDSKTISLTTDKAYAENISTELKALQNMLKDKDYAEAERASAHKEFGEKFEENLSAGSALMTHKEAIEYAKTGTVPERFTEKQADQLAYELHKAITFTNPHREYIATFGTSLEGIKNADIGVVEVKTKPGVKGEYLPAEKEWRVYSGEAIEKIDGKKIEPTAEVKDTGQQNEAFFTEKSKEASSKVPYEPVIKIDKDTPVAKAYDKYSAGGNFTGHISKMIPGFQEKQIRVAEAITKLGSESFLDIGASEGGLAKTVASQNKNMTAVAVDPNSQMKKNFESTPEVKNVEFVQEAFQGSWTEADGTKINEFKPEQKFDVINEDFTFQFVNNDRPKQVAGVKEMLNPDGLFITSEKFHTENKEANEAKKAEHQKKYFTPEERTADAEGIVTGMDKDMVKDVEYYNTLKENFKYVEEFWNAGEFKGYAASDSKATIDNFKKHVGDLTTEFTDTKSKTKSAEPPAKPPKPPKPPAEPPSELPVPSEGKGPKKQTAEQIAKEYADRITSEKKKDPDRMWTVDVPEGPDIVEASHADRIIKTEGGMAMVKADGDIVGIFKDVAGQKGVASRLLKEAINKGGTKLDNYDGYLTKIYEENGFKVASRIPFDPAKAPKDMPAAEKAKKPDVVFMVHDPNGKIPADKLNKQFETYEQGASHRDGLIPEGVKPPTPPVGPPPTGDSDQLELPEGPGDGKKPDGVKAIGRRRKARKEELKKKDSYKLPRWVYLFVDQQGPFKNLILKKAKEAGKGEKEANRVVLRQNTEKGTKARTADEFTTKMKEVGVSLFGKTNAKKIDLISEFNDVRRTKELYRSREAFGKKELLEEGGLTLKEAEDFLDRVKKKDPAILEEFGLKDYDPKKIVEASDKFNDYYREMLDEMVEEGVITREAYDQIVFEHPYYSPRRFMEVMDRIDQGGSMSGVEALKGGSEGAKRIDAPSLFFDALSRKNNIIARSRTLREMDKYIDQVDPSFMRKAAYDPTYLEKLSKAEKGDPWIKPAFEPTPKGMEAIDYKDANGHTKRIFMNADVHKYFNIEPFSDLSRKIMNVAGWASGSKALKAFATGYNPEFLVKNIPIDVMHILNTTTAYPTALPVAYPMMMADMTAVAKDAAAKTGIYNDYIKYGGGMKMLSGEGKLREGRSSGKVGKGNQLLDAGEGLLAYAGETSELLTRLALTRRQKINLIEQYKKEHGKEPDAKELKEITMDAVGYARNYLDFEQGGRLVKMADSVIPYLNAGFQVTRGSLRAAGNNPGLFAAKTAQLAGVAAAITAWNMGQFTTDNITEEMAEGMRNAYLNDISDEVKAKNFVIMSPKKYTDAAGNERYLYRKIPKDNMQELITGIAEDRVHKKFMGDDFEGYLSPRRIKELQQSVQSFTNVSSLPPMVRGALGYKLNTDLYYNAPIWPSAETSGDYGRDKSRETMPDTPPRFKAAGKIPLPGGHRLSPMRTHYFAKQFFTESNVIGTGIGAMMDFSVGGINQELKTDYTPDEVEQMKNAPFKRRFIKATYPGAAKRDYDTHEQDYNKLKKDHNDALDNLLLKEAPMEEVMEYLDKVLEDGEFDVTSQQEHKRLLRRYETEVLKPSTSKWLERMKYEPAIPRAEDLFDQWVLLNDEMRDYLIEEAAAAGILSETTIGRFSELMEEYETAKAEEEKAAAGKAKNNKDKKD